MTFKIKPHQREILAETILYAFGRRIKALSRMEKFPEYLEPFPIRKIQDRYKRADRRIIDEGINVWFEKVNRGNNVTKMCSQWKVRSGARLNPEILQFLRDLYATNIEHLKSLKAHINNKNGEPEVVVTTSFSFTDELSADMFMEIIGVLLIPKVAP
jgi:hypothetical protein